MLAFPATKLIVMHAPAPGVFAAFLAEFLVQEFVVEQVVEIESRDVVFVESRVDAH